MRIALLSFTILFFLSCSKNNDIDSNPPSVTRHLTPFRVTVVERAPYSAIIEWSASENNFNADTVKYDITLNGRPVSTNLTGTRDTIKNISPDSLYQGRVWANTKSGDTASAAFQLEIISGFIIFGDSDGKINYINAYSGKSLWNTTAGFFHNPCQEIPAIVDSTIYFSTSSQGSTDGILAVDLRTETKLWSSDLKTAGWFTSGWYTGIFSPVYGKGKVYTNNGSVLSSFDGKDGKSIWHFDEKDYNFLSNPVVASNHLFEYAFGKANKMIAIDINTGKKSWEFLLKTERSEICKNPVLYNDLVIFGASDGFIYALNQVTGALVWSRDFSVSTNNYGSNFIAPKVYNDLVIVHNGNIGYMALKASTGATAWGVEGTAFASVSSPAVGDGRVYFTKNQSISKLVALDPATGKQIWESALPSGFYTPTPIFAKNRLYLSNPGGYGILVYDALKGILITTLAPMIHQYTPLTVVIGDSSYYVSESGMVQ